MDKVFPSKIDSINVLENSMNFFFNKKKKKKTTILNALMMH